MTAHLTGAPPAVPRGIRNNNPGNLRRSKDPWQGLAHDQTDPEFFQFKDATWGVRALARTLITYQDKHGLKTARQMIARFAPPNENDTDEYAAFVVRRARLGMNEHIDVHRYEHCRPMVEAIIAFENANYAYPDAVIDKGLVLAGVEPPQKSLHRSRTIKGGQIAGGTGMLTTAAGVLASLAPALPVIEWMRDNMNVALIAFGVLVLMSVGWMVWARVDDARRGLR